VKKRYVVECPLCGLRFEGYEEFLKHVSSSHPDILKVRFRPRIIRLEENENG